MPSTHRKVSALAPLTPLVPLVPLAPVTPSAPSAPVTPVPRKVHTPLSAAIQTEACFSLLDGRWKLLILFHLFDGHVLRFSQLEKRVTGISQKMLAQQLRQLEADGIVRRTVHAELPPHVDYAMTACGQALCPALDGLLKWAVHKDQCGNQMP